MRGRDVNVLTSFYCLFGGIEKTMPNCLLLSHKDSPTLRAERKNTVVDWKKIKTEYITTNTSYRKLAKKYDIPFNTIQCRAKKEKWVELRNQYQDNIVSKSIKKAEESSIDYKSDLYDLAYKVATQLKDMINENTISDLVAMGIKPRDITGAIKDLEDALHIKSMSDIKEQEARIAKLRKETEEEKKDTSINITFGDEVKKYGV